MDRGAWWATVHRVEISCLSVASFAIIFSHSEGCLFTLLIVSFYVQKLLRLIRSHLFIFAFISIPRPTPKAYSFILLCTDVKASAPPTLPLQSLLAPLQAPTWIASSTHSDLPEVYPMQRSDAE